MSAAKNLNQAPAPEVKDQQVLKQAEAAEEETGKKRGFFYVSERKNYERKIDLYHRDSFMLLVR